MYIACGVAVPVRPTDTGPRPSQSRRSAPSSRETNSCGIGLVPARGSGAAPVASTYRTIPNAPASAVALVAAVAAARAALIASGPSAGARTPTSASLPRRSSPARSPGLPSPAATSGSTRLPASFAGAVNGSYRGCSAIVLGAPRLSRPVAAVRRPAVASVRLS